MKIRKSIRTSFVLGALCASAYATAGCVSDRPSRNGVFNENQYVRKDFLIRSGDGSTQDNGWLLKASVTRTSTPNPLEETFNIFPGTESGGALVRFQVTQDKLNMLNVREITSIIDPNVNTSEVMNAWPVTNVDLKYRVNLDGEKTNFFEENQELDWAQRQYAKLSFDKNDMSDLAPLGNATTGLLANCVDFGSASATLEPNSFLVDEANDYVEWVVNVTMPLNWSDDTCVQAYGQVGTDAQLLGGGAAASRQNVSVDLKYSLVRAKPMSEVTYKPLELAEKDPIQHKYGVIQYLDVSRDKGDGTNSIDPVGGSDLLAARSLAVRFDPEKPIVWYFEEGFPEEFKAFFRPAAGAEDDKVTVRDATNQLFEQAGLPTRVDFKDFNDGGITRRYGDVRYSFLRWLSDPDTQDQFAGVTQFVIDPRTGETVSSSIVMSDGSEKEYMVQRMDTYLVSIGASDGINIPTADDKSWLSGSCNASTTPTRNLKTSAVLQQHNQSSSLFQKMKEAFGDPAIRNSTKALGPQDFVTTQDNDFYNAYYKILPYEIFDNPDINPYTTPEGGGVLAPSAIWQRVKDEAEFQKTSASIDHGLEPFEDVTGPGGFGNATTFLNRLRTLTTNHSELQYLKPLTHPRMMYDADNAFSFEQVMAKNSQHCVDGQWESKESWSHRALMSWWRQVAWHEFGHTLGLEHNFMGSVDKNNFPNHTVIPAWDEKVTNAQNQMLDENGEVTTSEKKQQTIHHQPEDRFGMYTSSVMEYNMPAVDAFWTAGWGPYDKGAISFIYGNNTDDHAAKLADKTKWPKGYSPTATPDSVAGQYSINFPWNDSFGFDAKGTEVPYLYCTNKHMKYSPMCRTFDVGDRPAQIVANEIDNYEWQFQWRNFRKYRKFWDNSSYANTPVQMMTESRRFLSQWVFDWGQGDLADTFRRIGIKNPDTNGSDVDYYDELTNKFTKEMSSANQMVSAFHKAVVLQSSADRPYRTSYDKYFGDVTKQGIILDKLYAIQGWVGLWPTDNYDQNQAGFYLTSYEGLGDSAYNTMAADTVDAMIGGQYDAFAYVPTLPIAQFAQDTHDPSFTGGQQVRDWIGGWTFTRLEDFLSYFRNIATQNHAPGCESFDTCKYDPRSLGDNHNQFLGPDNRIWIWSYIPDRNTWVTVEKERNTASYVVLYNYNDYLVAQLDDGGFPGGVYSAELPMKYFLDSFQQFN